MKIFKKTLLVILFLLAVLIFYVAVFKKSEILSSAEVRSKYALSSSRFLDWNGTKVHYTDDGKGFPVIMIHGLGGSCFDFSLLDSMMRDSFRIIRVDLPGSGLSDFPKLKDKDPDFSELYGQFFIDLLDTLHLDSFYLVGNSMGGMMSWDLAAHYPGKVKKLVLLNSAGYDMKEVSAHVTKGLRNKWLQYILLKKGISEYFIRAGVSRIFYNKSELTEEKIKRTHDLWNKEGSLQMIFDLASTEKFPDTVWIKKIQCPTLILWGRQDRLVSYTHAERFHRDIPNSRVIIYDSCGHVPMIEKSLEVKKDVLSFFNGK